MGKTETEMFELDRAGTWLYDVGFVMDVGLANGC